MLTVNARGVFNYAHLQSTEHQHTHTVDGAQTHDEDEAHAPAQTPPIAL